MAKHAGDADLRTHVIALLEGGNAHITFDDAVKGFPAERAGVRPPGSPHSAWELLEHLRIAQLDIVLFSRGKDYVEMKWPDDYWPKSPAPKSKSEWAESVRSIRKDLAQFVGMLKDEGRTLFEPFPWGDGQTLLREALLIADHNSYHLGQLMLVRRMLESGLSRGDGVRPQPLIAVKDVERSSAWYQRLLRCRSNHGGSQYDQLVSNGELILQLHSFEVEHHHGGIGDPEDLPYGNGVLLWFEVDDFDDVMRRAAEMQVEIVMSKHRNPPDGNGGPNHWECWMRDPDGYTVVVASPYGSADGQWRPEGNPFDQ